MKKLILLSLLFCAFQTAQSQIQFEYDNAGNCVLKYKTVVMSAPRAPSQSQAEEETETETPENAPENQQLEDKIGDIKITLFPNPTKGLLQLEFENKSAETPVNYTLTDINGKLITSGTSNNNPLNLNLSSYAAGAYLLRISIADKKEIYKIIKQ
ncbi:MAG: T9SS type A sorting domain-containing protein [Prevotellaceae bacterium]|jgi:hypothetical protein|nr:T9SS type A sorting domain-containing protein [Prevotellaceae bacterium]